MLSARFNWREAVLCAAFGAVAALGQAPLGLWMLAVPALAGVMWRVARAERGWDAFRAGLFAGAGYFACALNWIIEPFLIDIARHGWMAPFAVVFLSFGLALFWGAAAALAHRVWRGHALLPLGVAFTLTGFETLRGVVFTGFPWALPGHIWIGTPLDQTAALIGPNGLTLFTLIAAALPVVARWRGAAMAVVLLGLFAAGGVWRLSQPLPPDRPVTLRLVQPAAAQNLKWDATLAQTHFNTLLALTTPAPIADLTIWPETAVPYLTEDYPGVAMAIAQASGGRPVALGIQRAEGLKFWNSLKIIEGTGQETAVYDKHHLVPFGEYMPLGDLALRWFGLRAFAAQSGNGYSAGQGPVVLDLGPDLGKVLPLICYEAVFPQDLRTKDRADWILQITNDAWFGTLTGPFQHMAQARLRAIEQGLPLIRVANTGVTAVVDARGRIRDQLSFGSQGFLDSALPGHLPATVYARWGEIPLFVLLAGLAVLMFGTRHARAA